MLNITHELEIRSHIAESIGGETGELMSGFVMDALNCYYEHIHWRAIVLDSPDIGVIEITLMGVEELDTGLQRERDVLMIKPSEGVAIVRPGDDVVEVCIDDLGPEPYFLGLERLSTSVEVRAREEAKTLCKVMRKIKQRFSIFAFGRGEDRRRLASLLERG